MLESHKMVDVRSFSCSRNSPEVETKFSVPQEVFGISLDNKKRTRRGKKHVRGSNGNDGCDSVRYSPSAPKNYTQYLLSDQNANLVVPEGSECGENFTNFLQAQFECDFAEARATELARMSRTELIDIIHDLEAKKAKLLESNNGVCFQCSVKMHTTNSTDDICSSDSTDSESVVVAAIPIDIHQMPLHNEQSTDLYSVDHK